MNEIRPKENVPYQQGLERVRNRYTTRKMYVDEFEEIWDCQAKHHNVLTDDLKQFLGGRKQDGYKEDGILFHQRPLRSQKHLVGNCTFEPNKTKCQLSAIPFEEFRVWQWVNTVEYNGKKISVEDRLKIVDFLFANEKPDFKKIRKAIGKESAEYKFNYKDEDKIVGTHTISNLSNKKFFGKSWFDFTEKQQDDIWHVLYFFDSKSNLKKYALEKWGFNEVQAEAISKFNLKDGYASISRKAINNILPFLKLGFTYDVAVVFGGIKNAFGIEWDNLSDEKRNFLLDNVESIVRSKIQGGFIDTIKDILVKEYGLSEKPLTKLYHHSASIQATFLLEKLPTGKEADKEIQAIRNPIVITALFELRKLVNELIAEHGKLDEIKVEMARDLKISKSQRKKIRSEQQRLERENDRVKERLNYEGVRITHDNMLLYKLWEECKKTCPYTGLSISFAQLFSGEVQIEHIHPWSRSLNDSFANKTLCFADENRKKGNKTPYEFYGSDEANWSAIKERALKLFSDTKEYPNTYQKFKRFVQQKFDDDFSSRQLNDTRYISKEAKEYLAKICKKIVVSPGQATSNLRYKWGLNGILNLEDDSKSRDDHRHHAVDALVLACTKVSYVQELSNWNRHNRKPELKHFPMPWDSFRDDAENTVNQILVSHKRVNNTITVRTHKTEKNGVIYKNQGVAARGQLHDKTFYGKNQRCLEDEYVYRVSINNLSFTQLTSIIDIKIRTIIIDGVSEKLEDEEVLFFKKMCLKEKKLDKNLQKSIKQKVEKILKESVFFMPNEGKRYKRLRKEEPLNFDRRPVPIMKVRIIKTLRKAERVNDEIKQFVDPQSNHHVLIYQDENGNMKEDVVTFWTVVERKRNGLSAYQLPSDGKEIVTTLHINDMFLLGLHNEDINWEKPNVETLRKHLYKIQTLSEMYYEFRLSPNATQIKDTNSDFFRRISSFNGWKMFNPIKVKISVSGKIEKG